LKLVAIGCGSKETVFGDMKCILMKEVSVLHTGFHDDWLDSYIPILPLHFYYSKKDDDDLE